MTSFSPAPSALDRLICDVAGAEAPAARAFVVASDPDGSLLSWANAHGTAVVVASDYREYARAQAHGTAAHALTQLAPGSAPGAVGVGHLPKSLAGIRYLARQLARAGVETLVLGANTKHMSRSMNAELARSYANVHASRGRGKFRCLVASGPLPNLPELEPSTGGPGGRLHAVGGVFGGASDDAGGRLLAEAFLNDYLVRVTDTEQRDFKGKTPVTKGKVVTVSREECSNGPFILVDLGCGNGSVSRRVLDTTGGLIAGFPQDKADSEPTSQVRHEKFDSIDKDRFRFRVLATDVDAAAVASARLTLASYANAGLVSVSWDDAGEQIPDSSADVVLLNPPFHDGAGIDTSLVEHLLDNADRLLASGGELYLVYNSHLAYLPAVRRQFGIVQQIVRDRRFTVLKAWQNQGNRDL